MGCYALSFIPTVVHAEFHKVAPYTECNNAECHCAECIFRIFIDTIDAIEKVSKFLHT